MDESIQELVQKLYQFVSARTLEESKHFLEGHPELLNLDADRVDGAWLVFQVVLQDQGASEEEVLRTRLFHALLDRCREVGVEQAYTEMGEESSQLEEDDTPTLITESIQRIISNTVAAMTRAQDQRAEWQKVIENALQDAQHRGADWQSERDFFVAVLSILDGQTPTLSLNHPYAYAVTAILEHIAALENEDPQDSIRVTQVGKPFIAGKTFWKETVRYNWAPDIVQELFLFFRNPKDYEQQAVKSGKAEYALVVEQDIIFFLFRFLNENPRQDGIDWSDTPYIWHLLPEEQRILPPLPEELGEEDGLQLVTVLINVDTGIVQAIRAETLSHEFTVQLYRAIRAQAYTAFDEVVYNERLKQIYERHPNSKALLPHAIVRSGGDMLSSNLGTVLIPYEMLGDDI